MSTRESVPAKERAVLSIQQKGGGSNFGWPRSFNIGQNREVRFEAKGSDGLVEIVGPKPPGFSIPLEPVANRTVSLGYRGAVGQEFTISAELRAEVSMTSPDNRTTLTITGGPSGGGG